MNIKKPLAGLAVAATLTLGFTGIAGAQTTSSSPAPTSHPITCEQAQDILARLHARDEQVKDRIAKAEARVDQLRAQGHEDRAETLQKRIDAAKDRLGKIEARVASFEQKVDQHCGTNSPDPSTTNPGSTTGSSAT